MTIAALALNVGVTAYVPQPRVNIQFRVLREGMGTPSIKSVRVARSIGAVSRVEIGLDTLDGEFTATRSIDLASLLAQGSWLILAADEAEPRQVRAAYIDLSEGGVFTINIFSGEGGGGGGQLGELDAIVQIDGVSASREVVALERQQDGGWRVAGYSPVTGGSGVVPVRVAGGRVFGVAVDDYGVEFTPMLPVEAGQRIRPTQFRGWLYEVTEPGILPDVEPQWWPMEGENASRELGTARAIAVRYYRPLAHGPVPVEMI